ncbi:MAG: DUF2283 domain-containing protein [Ignavibacteriales bacterium]|nr:DUF2283 domain-containing protein [Ignavibacteriales bacterium]
MEKQKLNFAYDNEGDILDISIGKPEKAISNEITDDFFVRIHPRTKRIVGFSILNFKKRSAKQKGEISVPLHAEFTM